MQTTPTLKLLLCAMLIAACTCSMAQEPPASPVLGSASPAYLQAKELLRKPAALKSIEPGMALKDAVDKLLRPVSGWSTVVGNQVRSQIESDISPDAQLLPLPAMEIGETTTWAALEKIVAAADAKCTLTYLGTGDTAKIEISRKHSSDMKKLVYFEMAGQRLDYVVKELLRSTDLNYVVSPEIAGLIINATLKGVPMDTAIGAVLKAAGADYRIEAGIVYVTPTAGQSQALKQMQMQPAPAAPMVGSVYRSSTEAPNRQQKVVSQAVQFRNINAGEVAPIISKPGVNVLSTNSNNAVITGPEDQVKEAASLIASLDKDEALPRPVRINVSAKATWNVVGKKPVVAIMNPSLSTAEGRDGGLEVKSETKDKADAPGMNIRFKMHAQPTVMSDGRISVSGSFAFEWVVKTGNIDEVLFSSPEVPVVVSLEPGKAQNVASLKMGTGREGEAVLDVTFTATIEKGRISPASNNSGGFGGGYGGYGGGNGRTW